MQRIRLLAPASALAMALAMAPVFASLALAADPVVTVKRGDTLTRISKAHGVPIATIVALNDLPNPNRIFPGQRLRLAAPDDAPSSAGAAAPAAPVHRVAVGENLTRIARRYGVALAAIVDANGIANPSRIFAGQRLRIPVPGSAEPEAGRPASPAATAARPARTHVVAVGENLTRIARRYGVTVAAIVDANGIANPSRIFAGQRLTIPGVAPAAPAARASAAPALPRSMVALMDKRAGVRAIIVEEAARYGVPAALALAVAWQESGWRQDVVSHAGAIGIMQLMPATAEWIGDSMLGRPVDSRDARQNVRAGVRLLGHYLDRYDGNRDLVLAAYYQGQAAADRHGVYAVSRGYIASIKVLERLLGG